MYRPYTLALLIASACASSTPGDTPAPEGVSRVSVSGWTEMEMHNAPGTGSRVVPLSPDSVWAALPKVYEEVGEFAGMVMPLRYKTFTPDGTMYGDHWVSDYRFRGDFDEMLMEKPENAVVDMSTNERAAVEESK